MDIRSAIKQVTTLNHLSADEMTQVMRDIMTGKTTDAQNAAFLVGLQMKGVQAEELLGGARVMRELVTRVELSPHEHLVDTCGTGGSGANKFNVSTASALVAACAGAREFGSFPFTSSSNH
jgi:anthranilate phosphoribosyltransferase